MGRFGGRGSHSISAKSQKPYDCDLDLENHSYNSTTTTEEVVTRDARRSASAFQAKLRPQIIATCIACIGAFGLGTVIGWSAPAIPSIKSTGALGGNVTEADESWMGSLSNLGAMTSGLFVGFAMEPLGRKYTILVLQLPALVGWILIAAAQNVGMVLAGRILTGFAGGAMTLIVPCYIGEIVQDRVRGTLSACLTLAIVFGVLFSYVLGALVSWIWLSIACGVVPILGCAILFMPESPRALLEQSKEHDAHKALVWLRGAPHLSSVTSELADIQKSIAESRQNSAHIRDLFVPSVLKPVGICLALMFFQQLGGINAVLFYAVSIFKSAGSDMDPNVSAILIGLVQVVVTVATLFLIDRLGRKPLLIFAEMGMAISLTALGIYFYLKAENGDVGPEGLGWLPLASLILFMITYGIGMGPLPWVLLGELSPPHIKGLAGGIGNCFCWGLAFLVTRTFGVLVTELGAAGSYWLFAACSLVGAIFAIVVVPETKGKSLDQINALFR